MFDQLIYQSQDLKAINLVRFLLCRSSPGSAKKYSQVPSATNELKELCRELFNAVKDCTVRDAVFSCLLEYSTLFALSSCPGLHNTVIFTGQINQL